MSINRNLQQAMRTVETTLQRVMRYVSGAVTRIFSPTDDKYPTTGVQPYEGDPAEKKTF
ncbi:MAG: hypothetical protein WCA35_00940 [Kovacikia sp.]